MCFPSYASTKIIWNSDKDFFTFCFLYTAYTFMVDIYTAVFWLQRLHITDVPWYKPIH